MAASPKSTVHNRKRKHAEVGLLQDDLSSLPSKRFKPPPAFWDNLSKIWLTRPSLKELDRRNALSTSSQSPVKYEAVREFKQKAQPTIPASEYLSKTPQADISLLKAFARRGGPDLTDLRGYSSNTMSSSRSSSKRRRSTDLSSATTKSRKSSTPYDRGFEQNLIDHGVYLDNRAQTPENLGGISERLANPRPSLSPSKFSESTFKAFRTSDFRAKDEDDIMIDVVPVISGVTQDKHFSARNTIFGNLEPLTDGNICPAKPDLYFGSRPEQLNRQVRDKLTSYIVPSTTEDKPMAPNFFLEVKGPDGSLAVAGRQACYNGAIGARGMQSLQLYSQKSPTYDNNAYTITSTYHGGQLKMYTTHLTAPAGPGKPPEYQMDQLGAWSLTGSREQFRQGAAAFRNGRDLAKEWRDGFISSANERVNSLNAEPPTLESPNHTSNATDTYPTSAEESESSADELALASYPVEEPKTSGSELALTSFSYSVEKSEKFANGLVFTSFLQPVEDDISADELDHTYVKPTAIKKRGSGSKTVSKDQRHRTTKSSQGRYPKK